ncbi:MAG: F0F1 ATP synthase subunit B [Spirulinaceae cyanobacterium RM2_2_10]|nr:F0F1 ATP synthase subunit B [Spirulinaceae cyanobacterium SM2_1_0]NJO20900.1 F0F1 ATP synthase subunit B [Spirulinaceae cyanobacterium RM2_2_10]
MVICPYLVAEASFGLDFNPLETNLVNLVIIIGVLVYFGRQFLGNLLGSRRERIQSEIAEAEQRAERAAVQLADAQQKLAQAQAEAGRIRQQASETAAQAGEKVLAEGRAEIERIREGAAQDVSSEQARAIADLRQRVATLALERAEARLQDILDESAQTQLIERSIAQLGGR